MAIRQDLADKVNELVTTTWGAVPNATVVPDIGALSFANAGAHMDVTVLYADIRDSTKMVDALAATLSAEYYKAFLHCASQLVMRNSGVIQAYDGDRVMAVFTGQAQADNAVSTALELNDAVASILNPAFNGLYGVTARELKFTVGIDSGACLVIKVGVRAAGELAFIGGAANYAAKLNSFEGLDGDYPIRITKQTLDKLSRACLIDDGGGPIWAGPYGNLKVRDHYRTQHIKPLR